jgi:phosphate starvation-inducible PhoH-like protein
MIDDFPLLPQYPPKVRIEAHHVCNGEKSISISIDTALLQAVCGTNDANLKALENALGSPITVRGNEIETPGLDNDSRQRFNYVMENLKAAASSGETPDEEYVRSVLACFSGTGRETPIRENLITVPHGFSKVYPRGPGQAEYVRGMRTADITFCVGPAGTGKTYLAIAMALSQVMNKKARKLILTRPVVEAGESLGYLPGDLAQKINP